MCFLAFYLVLFTTAGVTSFIKPGIGPELVEVDVEVRAGFEVRRLHSSLNQESQSSSCQKTAYIVSLQSKRIICTS